MSKVILIKDKTQLDQIISENENVVVDYFAEWCGPCKMLLPVLDAVSTEVNNVTICKVNVDDNSEIAKEIGIRSIPTVMYYKNGDNVATKMGYMTKPQLLQIFNENFNLN
jgi:thioredoxin 1